MLPTIPDDFLSLPNRRERLRERLEKLEGFLQQLGRPTPEWDATDYTLREHLLEQYALAAGERRAISLEMLRSGGLSARAS